MSDENSPQARAAYIVAQWNVYQEMHLQRTPEKAQALEDLIAAELERCEADLHRALASRDSFQEIVLAAIEQIGDVSTPLAVGIAQLKGEAIAARRLADAVELFHADSRAAEADPARKADLATAAYRLGETLADYRKAQRGEAKP
jgi:hypothetical protein